MNTKLEHNNRKLNYLKGVSKLFSREIFMRAVYLNIEGEEIDRIESMMDWYIVGKDIEIAMDLFDSSSKKGEVANERKSDTAIRV
jgi:hypothetical protein